MLIRQELRLNSSDTPSCFRPILKVKFVRYSKLFSSDISGLTRPVLHEFVRDGRFDSSEAANWTRPRRQDWFVRGSELNSSETAGLIRPRLLVRFVRDCWFDSSEALRWIRPRLQVEFVPLAQAYYRSKQCYHLGKHIPVPREREREKVFVRNWIAVSSSTRERLFSEVENSPANYRPSCVLR